MRVMDRRRVESLVRVVCALVAMSACAAFSRGAATGRIQYPLVVNNRSDFEVVVYAIPSSGVGGTRLGNARAFATTKMSVPRSALQGTDMLVLRIYGIGSSSRPWTTPGATVDSSVVATLDIRSDASGNMSRSSFYTELASLSHRP